MKFGGKKQNHFHSIRHSKSVNYGITVSVQSDVILPKRVASVSEMDCIPAVHCGWATWTSGVYRLHGSVCVYFKHSL